MTTRADAFGLNTIVATWGRVQDKAFEPRADWIPSRPAINKVWMVSVRVCGVGGGGDCFWLVKRPMGGFGLRFPRLCTPCPTSSREPGGYHQAHLTRLGGDVAATIRFRTPDSISPSSPPGLFGHTHARRSVGWKARGSMSEPALPSDVTFLASRARLTGLGCGRLESRSVITIHANDEVCLSPKGYGVQ